MSARSALSVLLARPSLFATDAAAANSSDAAAAATSASEARGGTAADTALPATNATASSGGSSVGSSEWIPPALLFGPPPSITIAPAPEFATAAVDAAPAGTLLWTPPALLPPPPPPMPSPAASAAPAGGVECDLAEHLARLEQGEAELRALFPHMPLHTASSASVPIASAEPASSTPLRKQEVVFVAALPTNPVTHEVVSVRSVVEATGRPFALSASLPSPLPSPSPSPVAAFAAAGFSASSSIVLSPRSSAAAPVSSAARQPSFSPPQRSPAAARVNPMKSVSFGGGPSSSPTKGAWPVFSPESFRSSRSAAPGASPLPASSPLPSASPLLARLLAAAPPSWSSSAAPGATAAPLFAATSSLFAPAAASFRSAEEKSQEVAALFRRGRAQRGAPGSSGDGSRESVASRMDTTCIHVPPPPLGLILSPNRVRASPAGSPARDSYSLAVVAEAQYDSMRSAFLTEARARKTQQDELDDARARQAWERREQLIRAQLQKREEEKESAPASSPTNRNRPRSAKQATARQRSSVAPSDDGGAGPEDDDEYNFRMRAFKRNGGERTPVRAETKPTKRVASATPSRASVASSASAAKSSAFVLAATTASTRASSRATSLAGDSELVGRGGGHNRRSSALSQHAAATAASSRAPSIAGDSELLPVRGHNRRASALSQVVDDDGGDEGSRGSHAEAHGDEEAEQAELHETEETMIDHGAGGDDDGVSRNHSAHGVDEAQEEERTPKRSAHAPGVLSLSHSAVRHIVRSGLLGKESALRGEHCYLPPPKLPVRLTRAQLLQAAAATRRAQAKALRPRPGGLADSILARTVHATAPAVRRNVRERLGELALARARGDVEEQHADPPSTAPLRAPSFAEPKTFRPATGAHVDLDCFGEPNPTWGRQSPNAPSSLLASAPKKSPLRSQPASQPLLSAFRSDAEVDAHLRRLFSSAAIAIAPPPADSGRRIQRESGTTSVSSSRLTADPAADVGSTVGYSMHETGGLIPHVDSFRHSAASSSISSVVDSLSSFGSTSSVDGDDREARLHDLARLSSSALVFPPHAINGGELQQHLELRPVGVILAQAT